jgi:hypothetical protein
MQMIPSPLPWISKADYPAFQRLIRELLNTSYEEWRSEHQKAVAYRQSRNGSTDIPVSPGELVDWLLQRRMAPHLEMLWEFAEAKAAVL